MCYGFNIRLETEWHFMCSKRDRLSDADLDETINNACGVCVVCVYVCGVVCVLCVCVQIQLQSIEILNGFFYRYCKTRPLPFLLSTNIRKVEGSD